MKAGKKTHFWLLTPRRVQNGRILSTSAILRALPGRTTAILFNAGSYEKKKAKPSYLT